MYGTRFCRFYTAAAARTCTAGVTRELSGALSQTLGSSEPGRRHRVQGDHTAVVRRAIFDGAAQGGCGSPAGTTAAGQMAHAARGRQASGSARAADDARAVQPSHRTRPTWRPTGRAGRSGTAAGRVIARGRDGGHQVRLAAPHLVPVDDPVTTFFLNIHMLHIYKRAYAPSPTGRRRRDIATRTHTRSTRGGFIAACTKG